MKQYIAAILWLLLILNAPVDIHAQISHPGTPPGFDLITTRSTNIPMEVMRPVAIEKLQQEDLIIDNIKDIPWRFGDNIDVDINPENSGVWYTLEGGGRLWQTTIYSPGALSINLTFSRYRLPPGAELYIYTPDREIVLGAFTDFNNQPDSYFSTSLLKGDKVIVEYFEPDLVEFPGELNIETVTHGYRDIQDFIKSFGTSGPCNLNVACDEIEGFEDQVRSIALMLAGGNGFCTGALINSTGRPGRPLFLSASHCAFNPGSLVLWFNWQSPDCDNPSTSPSYQSMSGAVELARYEQSDFYLLELMQEVPLDYNPYFSGWNRTLESSISGKIVGLHHPRADIKKMAYSTTGVRSAAYGGVSGSGSTHWRITWSGGTTTEPASSGSPLFDPQGRIIGQLHGGIAACGNTEPDWYGRLGISWNGGGTLQSSLKPWLDPANTGAMAINGYDPLASLVEDPDDFRASILANTSVLLQWKPDSLNDFVMIAVNTVNEFGQPKGKYTLSNELKGGGTIIYFGNTNSFVHTGLDPGEHYYYKIWSYNSSHYYSPGVSADIQMNCPVVTSLPWFEGFNATGTLHCWWQEQEQGFGSWVFGKESLQGKFSPYEGYSFAAFVTDSLSDTRHISRLTSQMMHLGHQENVRLAFYYLNAQSSASTDSLLIYSRTHPDMPWELIHVVHHEQYQWELINIPVVVSKENFQLSFRASAGSRGFIAVDGVMVYSDDNDKIAHPENLTLTPVNENAALLQWTMQTLSSPSTMEPQGFNLYRNEKQIYTTSDLSSLYYTDAYLPVGKYEYYVKAYYHDGFESEISNKVYYEVMAKNNDATIKFNISGFGDASLLPGIYLYPKDNPLKIKATPAQGWIFSHWFVNERQIDSIHTLELHMHEDLTVIAVFRLRIYTVEVNANPARAASSTKGGGSYGNRSQVVAAVHPSTGYAFTHWEAGGIIISTEDKLPLRILSDTVVTAYFTSVDYQLSLAANPPHGGQVIGEGSFQAHSEVIIEAIAEAGWRFVHWQYMINNQIVVATELPEYIFNLNDNILLTAVFDREQYKVNIHASGRGSTIPSSGEYQHFHGKIIDLSASPKPGWEFEKWVINNEDVERAETKAIIEKNTVITAVFNPTTVLSSSIASRKLLLYPVPASTNLWIEFPEPGLWQLYVYNISGQIILHQQATEDIHLDVSTLGSGVYMLRAKNGIRQEYMRFMKE
jgi:hypothetical protein